MLKYPVIYSYNFLLLIKDKNMKSYNISPIKISAFTVVFCFVLESDSGVWWGYVGDLQ